MADSIGVNGLVVKTAAEITADLVAGMQGIYGTDINTDANSPDGQMIGIITQAAVDIRELIVSVNASFDPDQAQGVILDQRVAINNITRQGGTYTVQPITLVLSKTVALQGLDSDYNNPNGTGFTVQDSSGNQFILATSATLTAGTYSVNFRAKLIGAVSVPINTITTPVTIIDGVTSVNNPSSAITVGQNQESDPKERVRRQRSVANASTGYANGLLGKILALSGVTEAALYQNRSDTIDANSIPPHSIWLVVAGGSSADIANTIYGCINDGAGMKGAVTYNITTPSGTLFVAKWDVPVAEPLYLKFTIKRTVAGFTFDTTSIKNYIAANLIYGIGMFAETSIPTAVASTAIGKQGGGGVAVLMQISSDGISYTDYLDPTTIGTQFTVSTGNIDITVV